ncbi:transglutaminase superfamily protein [Paenibacillus cellulosilyticus]|uniref:Transglutaminase superfamily protein n=1 Tax=Paenibacillus cellulosilyticus TaxID=375489 RepID=A0A2V2Z047_9BACL|nr:transglutaminase-like domain-containing protein [Paenibacillus cellulosilyticus]PWW07492.1 transglutaminase superfamily protein [Paenibacillus cellulosilyticus]QKS44354.1 transglutaminase domain-containing protein [Paenibacillus cellulosilyticus]
MAFWIHAITTFEPVAIIIMALLLLSLVQGLVKGASGSAKRLFFFVWDGVLMLLSFFAAWKTAALLSPTIAKLLAGIQPPQEEVGSLKQLWYTFVTSLRDFALFRYGVLILLLYAVFRLVAGRLVSPIEGWVERLGGRRTRGAGRGGLDIDEGQRLLSGGRLASRAIGGMIGAIHGAVRSLLLIAALFVYATLAPSGPFTEQIRSSDVYSEASAQLLEPVAGQLLADRGPVLTEAVGDELQRIIQRKYEIQDYAIPDNIADAALTVTKDASTDEEKARALYRWVGTRIAYDWDKARNYEEQGIWKEQTPADTFQTRLGVCIDLSRLYAVMARSVGLEVRVVTGMGGTKASGFGPHAWNEVRITDSEGNAIWVPLDATWAMSGDWFNPPGFEQTHIPSV